MIPAAGKLASIAREHLGENLILWSLTAAVLFLTLVLGGGTMQGLRSDALIQLASLPLLGIAITEHFRRPIAPQARLPLVLAASPIILVLVHLIPLPTALWTQLPGREFVVEAFELAAIPLGWMPISLDPGATWRSLLSLLPPLALFLAVLCTGFDGRRILSLLLVAFALASVVLGLFQLMQGPESALRFYAITNPGSSVGFFANRNHYAALLYSAVPFAAAWTIALASDRARILGAVGCGLALAALLLGLAMAFSRAGIVLGLSALLLSVLLLDGADTRKLRLIAIGIAGLTGAMILHPALPGILGRFESAIIDDYRLDILAITLTAAMDFLPLGSGFGTFPAIYLMYDRPEALLTAYVNHAHNDWAELWLEGGWPFGLAAAGFLLWFSKAARADWGGGPLSGVDRALRRAGAIAVCLILLHSLVDYPLRTVSLLGLFAFCCALQVRPCRREG